MSLNAFREVDPLDFEDMPRHEPSRFVGSGVVQPKHLSEPAGLNAKPTPLSKETLAAAVVTRPLPPLPQKLQGLQFTLDSPVTFREAGQRILQVHPERIARAAALALAVFSSPQAAGARPVTPEGKLLQKLQIKDEALAAYGKMLEAQHPSSHKGPAQAPVQPDVWKQGVFQVGTALLLLAAAHRIRKAVSEEEDKKSEPGLMSAVLGSLNAKRPWRNW